MALSADASWSSVMSGAMVRLAASGPIWTPVTPVRSATAAWIRNSRSLSNAELRKTELPAFPMKRDGLLTSWIGR